MRLNSANTQLNCRTLLFAGGTVAAAAMLPRAARS
jgi:hypothetical protein